MERAVSELGRLDTVVNNAGVMLLGPALDSPTAEWERMLAVNVQGMLYVTHAALPHLVRAAEDSPRGVADLVTISSTAGRVARPGGSVYSLTKFGVGAFCRVAPPGDDHAPGARQRGRARHGRHRARLAPARRGAAAPRRARSGSIEALRPEDIADAVAYIVTRDRRVAINEMLVRAGEQSW